jgi:uncharacterized protein DUF3592
VSEAHDRQARAAIGCTRGVFRLTSALSVLMVLVGLAVLAWAGARIVKRRAMASGAGRVEGTVTGFEMSGSADEPMSCAIVEFEAGSRRRRFRDGACFSVSPYSEGQRVTVLYDPARPDHAEIDSAWATAAGWLVAAGALAFTVLAALGVAVPLWLARRVELAFRGAPHGPIGGARPGARTAPGTGRASPSAPRGSRPARPRP